MKKVIATGLILAGGIVSLIGRPGIGGGLISAGVLVSMWS